MRWVVCTHGEFRQIGEQRLGDHAGILLSWDVEAVRLHFREGYDLEHSTILTHMLPVDHLGHACQEGYEEGLQYSDKNHIRISM